MRSDPVACGAAIKLMGGKAATKKLLYAQASKALRDEIQAINKEHQRERQGCYDEHKRRTWADWLKKEALQGNAEALAALRAREAAQGLKGNTVEGQGQAKPGHAPVVDNITKKGTIIFRAGKTAVRDDGDKLQGPARPPARLAAGPSAGNGTLEPHTVNGTTEFKAQIIRAAVDSQLPITFADPALEAGVRRLKKENTHDNPNKIEDELDAALAALDQDRCRQRRCPIQRQRRPRRPRSSRKGSRHRTAPEARHWTHWKSPAAPKQEPFASTVQTRCGSHRQRK